MSLRPLFGLLTFFLILSACQPASGPDDKPSVIVDTDLPSVTFTGFANNDTLRNTVTAEIKGTDTKGIKSIEVFANNDLIATATKSPVNLSWNTLTVKDGQYTIKAVATDSAGNKKELSTAVIIQNALFSFDPNDYDINLSPTTAYIVTDEAGKVLNSFKFTLADAPKKGVRTDIYPKTSFSGARVNVVRVQKIGVRNCIEYFINLKRGHYAKAWKSYEPIYSSPKLGQRKIAFKNIPASFGMSISSCMSGFGASFLLYPDPYFIEYTANSKVLVMYEKNNDFLYKLFDVIKPGGATVQDLDVALCTSKALNKTISLPVGAKNGSLYAFGSPYKDSDEQYPLGSRPIEGGPIKIFYPEELSNLSGGANFVYQGSSQFFTYYTELPSTIEPVNFSANTVQKRLTDFSASFEGDFQFYIARYNNNNSENPVSVYVIGYKDQKTFKFPDISAEITIPGFDPAQIPLTDIQMTRYGLTVDINMLFSWNLGPTRQASRSNYVTKYQSF